VLGRSIALAAVLGLACREAPPRAQLAASGDPERGRASIRSHQCGACHTIPGVTGARGIVGPPLAGFGARAFIAGELPNTPENLVRWIQDPPAIEPETAMPALGVAQSDARDIAAYLYQLR
jgi:cytochrome c1